MSHFIESWYVIYTRPKQEKKVKEQLAEAGITSFLPMVKALRQWHDRKKFLDMPLFPSYIFVYLKSLQDYFCGMNTSGFLYYVKTGKDIARIGATVIDHIRLAVGGGQQLEVSELSFEPGQQLLINNGPLTGLSGEVVRVNGRQKLLIRVNLLQRNLLVTLPVEDLVLA